MKKIVLIFLIFSIISCAKEKDTITSNEGNNNSLVVNQKKLQEMKNKLLDDLISEDNLYTKNLSRTDIEFILGT